MDYSGSRFKIRHIALSFWFSPGSLQAWGLSIILSVCTIGLVVLNMLLNKWQVGFYNQLQSYNYSSFVDALVQFAILSAILVFFSGYQTYFRLLLEIRWRHSITDKYISAWLHNQTYYHMNILNVAIDNPDQRISEDVRLFTANTLDLALGLFRHIITLLVFSVILWQLSGSFRISIPGVTISVPGYLIWSALLYSFFGTWLTIQTGRTLVTKNIALQSNEAHFRHGLFRLKEHDECIALYRGETQEKHILENKFHRLMNNYVSIMMSNRRITWLSTAYSQFSFVFAFLIASPRYFNNEIQLGQLFEISGAYWFVHAALSYIIESFSKIALWKAVTVRLNEFGAHMAEAQALSRLKGPQPAIRSHARELVIKNLTVFSPLRQILLKELTINLKPRDSLLISGPTGCGKTTLLRTLAGIWPYFQGTIILPASRKIMFLPQKPYFPTGNLRNALLYPAINIHATDAKLCEVLQLIKLPQLIRKLNDEDDWEKVLSLGEQQRLSLARVILQQPDWLFLDEVTSSMDHFTEQYLYGILRERMPNTAVISVGHRDELKTYHNFSLLLDGTGLWQNASLPYFFHCPHANR